MLKNKVCDSSEVQQMTTMILDRLSLLCAPAHDAKILELRNKSSVGCNIGVVIFELHEIIDDIEELMNTPESVVQFCSISPSKYIIAIQIPG